MYIGFYLNKIFIGIKSLLCINGQRPCAYSAVCYVMLCLFNSEQTEAITAIPLERLLLETDAPYLPIRKNIHHNSPVYLGELMERVAALRGLTLIEVSKWNEDNFQTVFKL